MLAEGQLVSARASVCISTDSVLVSVSVCTQLMRRYLWIIYSLDYCIKYNFKGTMSNFKTIFVLISTSKLKFKCKNGLVQN